MDATIMSGGDPMQGQPMAATVFESADHRAEAAAFEQLAKGARSADLAALPVVLPDFHHKRKMEMPSSIAIATRGSIRPTFTSSSVNCGMALLTLETDRPGPAAVAQFFEAVRQRFPYPPSRRLELSGTEVVRAATEGAAFTARRFDLDPSTLDRIEERGCLDLEHLGGPKRLERELPWLTVQLSRMRFGTMGPSNHFIELQQVEEVLDPEVAATLGVRQGQMTVQMHGGGGVMAGQIGRLFGKRKKIKRATKAVMAVQKPLHHLATARSLNELRTRRALYFAEGAPPIDSDSDEGRRFLLANAAAMNYGFAFRLYTYAHLQRIAEQVFGSSGGELIVDSPHNSIYEEEVDGEPAVVHRHNACRAYPAAKLAGKGVFGETGQALLLPGTNRTSSYLCVADDLAAASLYSACHGAGTVITDFVARGLSAPDPLGRSTTRFDYKGSAPVELPHFDDRGVDEALEILVRNGLVRPIARMRPLAGLN